MRRIPPLPLFLSVLLLSTPLLAGVEGGPFADVPKADPAYAAVRQLASGGLFTGYPKSTFDGSRLLTRYEFAVAIQRMSQEWTRTEAATWDADGSPLHRAVHRMVRRQYPSLQPDESGELARLIRSFQSELAMLGSDPEVLLRQVRGVPAPEELPVPERPRDEPQAALAGRQSARREWEAGRAVIYTGGLVAGPLYDSLLGIPLHFAHAGCLVDEATMLRERAHNDEVYRLALERGLPANSRIRWLSLLQHPENVETAEVERVRLSPQATARHFGEFTVTVRRAAAADSPLVFHAREWGRDLPVRWDGTDRLELFAGPSGSELLFLRLPGEPTPFAVIDLRCGERLR